MKSFVPFELSADEIEIKNPIRFGFKMSIIVGMPAWGLRYFLFDYGDTGKVLFMLLMGITLYGLYYDFFFVAGQIYPDFKADEKNRSSVRSLITSAPYGVGMLIGFYFAGLITYAYIRGDESHEWTSIWTFPAIFAIAVMVLFAMFFKKEKIEKEHIEV